MTTEEVIGAGAAILTTSSFLPQAIKVVRTRDTGAISLSMYVLFTAGVTLWGIYGVMTWQWSIIIANGVTVVLAATILSIKVAAVLGAARKGRAPSAN
jgi:MtN3 and saliva related transmembrane protein